MEANRSFEFIAFPSEPPPRETLVGHDRLYSDCYHGSLTLELEALTPIFISAGVTALGIDVGETVPLIRVMGQQEGKPVLQGTSLKGCIRAVYETITNSSVGVAGTRTSPLHAPHRVEGEKLAERRTSELSPAELVFGAMGFQGLISIADAMGDRPLERGYLPPMFPPQRGRGRKFYVHQNPATVANASSTNPSAEPDKPPSPIQQAPVGTIFTATLRFSNLALAQLGALLIALGQDTRYSFDLKLGAGKGKGLGSLAVRVCNAQITQGNDLKASRYLSYHPTDQHQTDHHQPDCTLADAIEAAHQTQLIHAEQLQALWQILRRSETEA